MANQYKNKVVYNGTTLIDISDTTAVQSDVASGKTFYTASGQKVEGIAISGSNAISVVDTTDSHGGTIRTITAVDISDTTAIASDVASGKYFYTANGTKTLGSASGGSSSPTLVTKEITSNGTYTASNDSADGYSSVTVNVPSSGITPTGSINITTNGTHDVTNYASAVVNVSSGSSTPSATKHTIHFDFSDETDTDIDVYYDDTLLTTIIQEYTPVTYGQKTVTLAQLDGVAWYEPTNIPLNTQLVDYNAVLTGYTIGSDGSIITSEAWNCVTDYIPIDPTMTFSFKCQQYALIGFYNTQKNPISIIEADNIKDSAEDYVASGYLTPSIIPLGTAYVVLRGNSYGIENTLSLIRTA